MNNDKRNRLVLSALEVDNDGELISTIIENIGNVTVEDVGNIGGNAFEIFINPSSFSEYQLKNIQEIFTVKEIGIYGDPDLPDDPVYFHMIVSV